MQLRQREPDRSRSARMMVRCPFQRDTPAEKASVTHVSPTVSKGRAELAPDATLKMIGLSARSPQQVAHQ